MLSQIIYINLPIRVKPLPLSIQFNRRKPSRLRRMLQGPSMSEAVFKYGIYKSTDGSTWAQVITALPLNAFGDISAIQSLAVDPSNISNVWAGISSGGGIEKNNE
jgi:hypothetical protein